jgi:hypothetical protein
MALLRMTHVFQTRQATERMYHKSSLSFTTCFCGIWMAAAVKSSRAAKMSPASDLIYKHEDLFATFKVSDDETEPR